MLQGNNVVGSMNLRSINNEADSAELGYFIRPDLIGGGICFYFIYSILEFAFEFLDFRELYGATNTNNKSTTLFDEFFGFKITGEKKLKIGREYSAFIEHWLTSEYFFNQKEELKDIDNLLRFMQQRKKQNIIMEIKDFITAFADQFEDTNPAEITKDTAFHDLDEWDSLIALAVLNMTEKKYGKKVTFGEMKVCKTIEDLFNVIASK